MHEKTSGGVHEKVLALIDNVPKGKILDLGCGTGILSQSLHKKGWDVTACDINPPKLKGIDVRRVDLNQPLPFKDKQFDVVVTPEVIEHLENIHQFIREIHRVLKPKGICILSTPNIQNWYGRLLFLFTAKFPHFIKETGHGSGHITPVSVVLFRRMIKPYFHVKEQVCNKGLIPLLRLTFKTNSLMFGDVMIFKLQKK